jgi:hypothetical protein
MTVSPSQLLPSSLDATSLVTQVQEAYLLPQTHKQKYDLWWFSAELLSGHLLPLLRTWISGVAVSAHGVYPAVLHSFSKRDYSFCPGETPSLIASPAALGYLFSNWAATWCSCLSLHTSGTDSHPASWFPAVPFYLLEPHHGLYQLLSLVSQVEGSSNFEISHSRWNYFDHLRFKSETYKLETKGQLILQGNAVWITNPYKNKNICLFDMWSFIFS